MNIRQTLEMTRPGSIIVGGEFAAFVQSILKGTRYMPHSLTFACGLIEKTIQDHRVLTTMPLLSVQVVDEIDGDTHVSGRYDPETRTILFRENVAMRGFSNQVMTHEIGHHFTEQFINPANAQASGCDYGFVNQLRQGVMKEYQENTKALEDYAGHSFDLENIDKYWEELWAMPEFGPSRYAYRNMEEWIAESWAWYFIGEIDWLALKAPASLRAIQSVVTGKVFI